MESRSAGVDQGAVDYYLNRLIQRAVIEPKPLLKIYAEECQRHPLMRQTVSFKDFESSLQKHCMFLYQSRQQHSQAPQIKQEVAAYTEKQNPTRFAAQGDSADRRVGPRQKRTAVQQGHSQRMPQSVLDRFSPQGSNAYNKTSTHHPPVSLVNVKTEDSIYTSQAAVQPTSHSVSRPPSAQPPVEEEAPPEFIEMTANAPRIMDNMSGMNVYKSLPASDETIKPVLCKAEPKDIDSGGGNVASVQSSSPLSQNSLLSNDEVSPLNVRCVKCIAALVTCAVMPCGHCCLCNVCAETALSLKHVCPVCRKSITTVIGYSHLIYNVNR